MDPKALRRALRYGRFWLPRMPGDYLASRRYTLPGGYRRVLHRHVAKTGGTSLNRSFLALGGENVDAVHGRILPREPTATRSGRYVFVARDPRALRRGHYFFAWTSHPVWFVEAPPLTFEVSVLRHPLDRVLSLYRYLSDPGADSGLPITAGPWRNLVRDGFDGFIERIPANNLHQQLDVFSRGHDPKEAAERIRALGAYFFTECYDAGLSELARRLQLPLRQRRDRVSTGPPPAVTADQRQRLVTMLEPEFELLELLREDPGPLLGQVPRA